MTIPFYKKWLSYFKEIHLESAPSDLNPHLYVSLIRGRIQLSTAHAIYSFEDLYDNFGAAFKLINWDKLKPKNILVLGGGLLSVPYLLEKYLTDINTTVVEYDEEVIYLATKYILEKIDQPIQMIHTDASTYVTVCQDRYDLIIVDVFDDDIIPDEIEDPEFLNQIDQLLNPDGLILFNRLSRTIKDLSDTKKFFEAKFKKHFDHGYHIDVDGNWILANTPNYRLNSTTSGQAHEV